MNPRRALATAAVAAVLVPVCLLAAPAALATGEGEGGDGRPDPSADTSASPYATATGTGAATTAPSGAATASQTPSATRSPTTSASPTAGTSPSPSASATTTPGATPTDTLPASPSASPTPGSTHPVDVTATPSATHPRSPSTSPTASPSGSPDVDVPNGVCAVAGFDVRVSGLPATVAAGSTTAPFTVVLDNTAGADATRVQFGLAVAFRDGLRDTDWLAAQEYVSVRYYDWNAERWRNASTDGGVYTYADIEAGRRYEMRLRLVLAPDTPPGAAGALAFSTHWDTGRTPGGSACVYDNEWYRFRITASGSAPAVSEVRPQGGSTPMVLRPASRTGLAGGTHIEGALAETGSGPGLGVAAAASVTAVVLGAAALLFATRRRR